MYQDKSLRRGLFYLGMAVVSAIMSGVVKTEWVSFIWFVAAILASFMAYLYLMWEG